MSDYVTEVYRTMQVFNQAISDAVHAGFRVDVGLGVLCSFDGRDVTTVRVEVLALFPIPSSPPDEQPIAINEYA